MAFDCLRIRIITRHNELQSSGHIAHVMSCSIIQYKGPVRRDEPSFLLRSMTHPKEQANTRVICIE